MYYDVVKSRKLSKKYEEHTHIQKIKKKKKDLYFLLLNSLVFLCGYFNVYKKTSKKNSMRPQKEEKGAQ